MVSLNGKTSLLRNQSQGVPQGSVVSPTLFNISLYDFPRPPPFCSLLVFADDIIFTVQASSTEEAQTIVQPYLDSINRWAIKWRFRFSASKSGCW